MMYILDSWRFDSAVLPLSSGGDCSHQRASSRLRSCMLHRIVDCERLLLLCFCFAFGDDRVRLLGYSLFVQVTALFIYGALGHQLVDAFSQRGDNLLVLCGVTGLGEGTLDLVHASLETLVNARHNLLAGQLHGGAHRAAVLAYALASVRRLVGVEQGEQVDFARAYRPQRGLEALDRFAAVDVVRLGLDQLEQHFVCGKAGDR